MRGFGFNTTIAVLIAVAAIPGVAPPARAQGKKVVIYRCTDAFGAVTMQNDVACPKGTHQERKVIDVPPAMPAYKPAPAIVAPPPADPQPADAEAAGSDSPDMAASDIPAAERLPPPPLYRCNTYDNDSYLSDTATPPQRCVRLDTVGIDGSADGGAGVACQLVNDQCQRVPDNGACKAWAQRMREAEAAWKFGAVDEADATQAEYERVRTLVRDSTCGK